MPVGGPRIGERDALDEAPSLRAHCCPQPECSVDVKPGVRLAHDVDDLREVIERSGIHLAGLRADDRRAAELGERRA